MKKILQILLITVFSLTSLAISNAQCDEILIASPLCTNSSVLVTLGDQANANCLPSGNVNYSWQVNQIMGGPDPNITDNNDNGTATISDLGSMTGDFAIEVSINPPGGGNTYVLIDTFTIFMGVVADAGTDEELTCSVTSVMLDGSSSTAGQSYLWTASSGGNITSGGTTLTPTVDMAGTYTLVVTASGSGCTDSDVALVTEDTTAPDAQAGGDEEITCSAATVVLSGSSSTPGATFSWTASAGGNIVSGGGTATPTVNAAGTYTLTVTAPNGCTSSDVALVTEDTTAPDAQAGDDQEISCTSTTVMLNGSSTTPGATFSWTASAGGNIVSGGGTATPTVNAAGTYTLIVTAPNGCTASDVALVTSNVTAPDANAGPDKAINCIITSVTLEGSSQTSGATFSWAASNGGNIVSGAGTATPTVNSGGTYTLTVTDPDNGCTATDQAVVVANNTLPTIALSPTSPACNSGLDGSIAVTVTNGTPNYSWSINPASNSGGSGTETSSPFDIENLQAGSYTVTVTDGNGCSDTESTNVAATPALALTFSSSNPDCNNGTDGSITATVSNGTANYLWSISPPPASGPSSGSSPSNVITINNLTSGTYTISITDGNMCSVSGMRTLTNPAAVTFTATADNPTCNGGGDGSFSINVSNGTSNYSYTWQESGGDSGSGSGETSEPFDISGLSAGTYGITVTDGNGCTAVAVGQTIVDPPALSATLTSTDGACVGDNNGSYRIESVANGASPYSYNDGTGMGGPITLPFNVTNRAAGTYTVTITDANMCTTVAAVTVAEDPLPNIEIGGSTAFCEGSSTTLSAQEPGGNVPGDWSYMWSNNSTMQSITVSSPGTYTVTVTNGNDCESIESVTVVENASLEFDISASIGLELCGTETQNLSAPLNANYTYLWNTNATTSTINVGAGQYSVTVTDNSVNCTGEASISIITNDRPTAVLSAPVTEYCVGDPAPNITVTLTGQAPFDFIYTINGSNPTNVTGVNGTTFTINNATAGTYQLISLNDANCPSIMAPVSNSIVIIENSLPVVSIVPAMPAFCPGSSVDVSVQGSFSSVTWRKGMNQIGMGNTISISEAGTDYSVEVEDGNSCRNVLNFSVQEQNNVVFNIQADPGNTICPGETVTLDAGDFEMYLWSPGNQTTQTIDVTQAGTYTCTVTDANGCTGSNAIVIAPLNAPTVSSPLSDLLLEYCEDSQAPNVVFILNGLAPFTATYSFNNGPDQNAPVSGNQIVIAGASPGTYKLTSVSDANCTTLPTFESAVVTVQENPRPDFEITSSSGNIICPGEITTLSATETYPAGYSYSWSGPVTSSNATLPTNVAGAYTLLITSDDGCSSTAMYNLAESNLSPLTITTDDADNAICNGQGSITLTINNATSWIWQNGAGNPNQNNIVVSPSSPTTYTADLTNNDGCVATRSVNVNVFTPPSPSISNASEFYCEGSIIALNVSQAYAGGYLWSNDNTSQAITPVASFDGGENPVYSVTVTDENGCTGEVEEEVSIRELPTAGISTLPPPVQTSFVIDFDVVNPEFDEANDCGNPGDLSYVWNFNNSSGSPVVTLPSSSSNVQYTFELPDTVIAEVALTVQDGCGCVSAPVTSPYSIIPNGSCGASIAFPSTRCIGEVLTFDAEPKLGNPAPNKIFNEGYFIIENIKIKLSDINLDEVISSNGKEFIVRSISSISEDDANDVVEIEFTEAITYGIRYYVDYGGCERTTPINNFKVNPLPEFDSFSVDLEACANENHVATFEIDNNDFDYEFRYDIGLQENVSKLFNQISNKTITFAGLPEGTTTFTFGNLTDTKTGCVNESYAGSDFDLVKFSPLQLSFEDLCNEDLDSIFYTLEITGSTGSGNYNVKIGTEDFDLPGSTFTTGALVPGIATQFTVTDLQCNNPTYSVVESYSAICDSCYLIQDISDDKGNNLPSSIQLCEGEGYNFVFDNTFEDIILDQHRIVYAIQSSAVSVYDEDEIVQLLITEKGDVNDPRFNFAFDMDTLRTDVEYYLSAYLVLNSQTLQPLPGCTGLTPIPVRWNSNANSTIGLLDEEDGIACQQEIDYQLFILTDPADNLKQINYLWSSSGNVSFTPENQNIDVDGDRALAIFGENPAGPLEIYLNQSYTISGRTCESVDTLELEISEIVSPSEDTIIGFPGDLFTFPIAGLCYQWGVNEDLIAGETTQYLALPNGLGNNVLWIDIYDCNSTDPNGLCVTRVYYNAPEPPKLSYAPNENLDIKLIPNPNNGQFTLDFFGDQGGRLYITIVNSTGVPVQQKVIEKERRFQKESFELLDIDAGLYFIQVIDEGGYRHVMKFIKQ